MTALRVPDTVLPAKADGRKQDFVPGTAIIATGQTSAIEIAQATLHTHASCKFVFSARNYMG